MSIAFLVTSPYQVFHYRHIARHLPESTVLLEIRDKDFGLTEKFVRSRMPDSEVAWVSEDTLADVDGTFDVIVCQTPILPLKFLSKSLIVAQQYSLAKERYQYGVWRAHAHANLMYGPGPVRLVEGFCSAVACGNPLLDPLVDADSPPHAHRVTDRRRPRLLYLPTYGELSSLRMTLPRLGGVEADVTVKLHHAADADGLSRPPGNVEMVYSDTDPVDLLREHDGVVSDASGAIYDALYAGLPVVVTDSISPGCHDYDRLSVREQDGSRLRDITATWDEGRELIDAFAAAEAARESAAFTEFAADTFVNPGGAGAACAAEILRLREYGESPHFAVAQVRETTARYIQRNRQLKSEPGGTATGGSVPSLHASHRPLARLASAVVRRTSARTRLVRRKLGLVRRPGKREFVANTRLALDAPQAPAPSGGQRESIFNRVQPFLESHGVRVVRDGAAPGAAAAVTKDDRRNLFKALRACAESYPQLRVRIGSGRKLAAAIAMDRVYLSEFAAAHWIELESGDDVFPLNAGRRLAVYFVEYDSERNRYLATKNVVDRHDWTDWFAVNDRNPATVSCADDPPRHAAGPIDFVYTWVNSACPQWQSRYREYRDGGDALQSSANAERYVSRDELRHSLRSVWMFAPFVRNIYIVTDDQHPEWLAAGDPRVRVVSHREIFPDPSVLPTFNSHAIEANLHLIPGLSENFLYFNDDVFLGRDVDVCDFFTMTGMPKVRLSPSQFVYRGVPEPTAIPTDWAAYNSLRLIESEHGRRFNRRVKHVPLPLNKSVLAEIERRYPRELAVTRAARFRSATDVALPSMLAQYYAIATGRAVEWPNVKQEYVYLDTGREDCYVRFKNILDWQPAFFCLNSTRHTVIDLETQARNLSRFLAKVYPVAAPWEVGGVAAVDEPRPLAGNLA